MSRNLPVEQNQLAVHRKRRTLLDGVNTGLQLRQPVCITQWVDGKGYGGTGGVEGGLFMALLPAAWTQLG